MYGTTIGMCLTGLAIGLHGWILVQHALIKEFKDVGERVILMVFVLITLALIYWGVRTWTLPDLTGGYTSLTIAQSNIQRGDYLLAWRDEVCPEDLTRGSLVLARLANTREGRGIWVRHRNRSMIGQVIGVPGDTVEIRGGLYAVNGKVLEGKAYPLPQWLRGRTLSATIRPGAYFVSSEYTVQVQGVARVSDDLIRAMCLVDIENIEGRAFMRWLPISRRGYIEEIE